MAVIYPRAPHEHTGRVARACLRRRGFTLTELLTVFGLIALLVSLFVPIVAKVRAAADSANCLSNLRQMGTAWTMYGAENRGRFMDYTWHTPASPDLSWKGYWTGILESQQVRGASLLCPSAAQPTTNENNMGCGDVGRAWTGQYTRQNGTGVRFDDTRYRVSSYGYNGYLSARNHAGDLTRGSFSTIQSPSDTPVFIDCAYCDVLPPNLNEKGPVQSPPNLRGDKIDGMSPEHWRFLLARHGRGVNVVTVDGGARWVPLEETYRLTWASDWQKYLLRLPRD